MPKRSNQFQRLVFLISNSIAGNARVIESAMLTDKINGELREVDVLIVANESGYELNIAIEVVARGRKADTPWVESMYSKHSSLPTNKLILVAERGFTSPALQKARFYGIEAVTIETALATDWKLVTELTAKGIFELTFYRYSCSVIYKSDSGTLQQVEVPLNSRITSNSKQVTFDEFVRYLLSLPETANTLYSRITSMNERQFWFSVSMSDGLGDVEVEEKTVRAIEIRVGLDVDYTKTLVEFSTGKYLNRPFVSGISASKLNELQFVLMKKPDGTTEGTIVAAFGVGKLVGTHKHSDEI